MIPSHRLQGPCLFMSDLHLNGGPRDQAPLEALRFIAEGGLGQPPAHIVLVGDLFDFNLGYRRSIYPHLQPAYELLFWAANRGAQLWIFSGNHDPDPCPHLRAHPRVTLLPGPALFTFRWSSKDGARREVSAVVEHGDLCEERWAKRALCRVARMSLICRLARCLPPPIALKLAPQLPDHLNQLHAPHEPLASGPLRHAPPAHLSRRWGAHLESLRGQSCTPQLWVMGHFHEAKLNSLSQLQSGQRQERSPQGQDREDPTLALLGDWVQLFTCLIFNQGEVSLYQHHPSAKVSAESFTLLTQAELLSGAQRLD